MLLSASQVSRYATELWTFFQSHVQKMTYSFFFIVFQSHFQSHVQKKFFQKMIWNNEIENIRKISTLNDWSRFKNFWLCAILLKHYREWTVSPQHTFRLSQCNSHMKKERKILHNEANGTFIWSRAEEFATYFRSNCGIGSLWMSLQLHRRTYENSYR